MVVGLQSLCSGSGSRGLSSEAELGSLLCAWLRSVATLALRGPQGYRARHFECPPNFFNPLCDGVVLGSAGTPWLTDRYHLGEGATGGATTLQIGLSEAQGLTNRYHRTLWRRGDWRGNNFTNRTFGIDRSLGVRGQILGRASLHVYLLLVRGLVYLTIRSHLGSSNFRARRFPALS